MTSFDPPIPADNGWLLPVFQAAYHQRWTEEDVERKMAADRGVMRVERPRLFCSIEFYELEHPIIAKDDVIVIPAGMATQVKDILPQHQSQEWVDRTLGPLVAETLIAAGERWPEALTHPSWGWMPNYLAPLWANLFNANLTPHGSRTIAWVPTLQEAIDKAKTL